MTFPVFLVIATVLWACVNILAYPSRWFWPVMSILWSLGFLFLL